jgi:hypothetical protein
MHQVECVKSKQFCSLFYPHEQQQLKEVGTNVTVLKRILYKTPARVKPPTRDKASRIMNMTPLYQLPFESDLSELETDAKTWTGAAMDVIKTQLV